MIATVLILYMVGASPSWTVVRFESAQECKLAIKAIKADESESHWLKARVQEPLIMKCVPLAEHP